ncbi:MAG: DUF4118 domain-containing protein [Phycisphaerales bacterium]
MLRAGIDVLTTLNVQHLESLNDVVARITGVAVRETVPDAVVEGADEVELVDLPPEALLQRLRAGKVYVPESARAAIDSFFRKGNLTALRELALRRTAEWVDAQMRDYREGKGIRTVWPAADRVLVCVGPSPSSANLLRAAQRIAAGLRAKLIAVHVERPAAPTASAADRDRVMQTLRLAESLGAETVTLATPPGSRDAAGELVAYARSRNVSRIVVGKTGRPRLREALAGFVGRGSFMNEVIRRSGEIDVIAVRGDDDDRRPADDAEVAPPAPQGRQPTWTSALAACAMVAATTAVAGLCWKPPDLSEEAMVYLAGVVVTAWRFGRTASIVASVLSVLAFNFFFTEPRFTFMVSDASYLVTFAVMLAAGLLVGTLTARTREQADASREREHRMSALYGMSRELSRARDLADVAAVAASHLRETFAADVAVLRPLPEPGARPAGGAGDPRGPLEVLAFAGAPDWLDERERGVARWAFDHGRLAGAGTPALPSSVGRYLPLTASQGKIGVLAVRPSAESALGSAPQQLLMDTLVNQIALALERVSLIEGRQAAMVDVESERLRATLLSCVSHDLRTPLAGIAGAASTLRDSDAALDPATRRELVDSIVAESARLNELIGNLVFATRLQSGRVELRREWTTVEEVVGAGLRRRRGELARRPLRVHVPADLPMIRVDNAMLPQVVENLVENALRYTPDGTPIAITARVAEANVVVAVADEGPGIGRDEATRVFERFFRGRTARPAGTVETTEPATAFPGAGAGAGLGLGLGLTICQGIIAAHGGRIWVEPNVPRGVSFLFSLPIEHPQPRLPSEVTSDAPSHAADADSTTTTPESGAAAHPKAAPTP